MTNYTENAKWFYKPVEIADLEKIQQELMPVLREKVPDIDSKIIFGGYKHVTKNELILFAPTLIEVVKKLGVFDRLSYATFVIAANKRISNKIPFNIHIDHYDWRIISYALNIPILNCENTYTVWYDTELDTDIEGYIKVNTGISPEAWSDENLSIDKIASPIIQKKGTVATEIARLHSINPAWVNISIPHAPINTTNEPRVLISLRFSPELHDILHT